MSSLVSVIIVTYNSSEFVIETLDSVFNQTWRDIDLIITDDCSKDRTVELCSKWLSKNAPRFSNVTLLTSEHNSGVAANANRGLHASKGEWIKFLGADDTLKPTCIENNIRWINDHPEIKVLFSYVEIYKNSFESCNLLKTTPGDPFNPNSIMANERSVESQYKMLLVSDRIHFSPSVFLNRSALISVGAFDERFKLLEDYPLWLKFTQNGYKLYFMNNITVQYRQHEKAINNNGKDPLINPNYYNSESFRRIYTYPNLPTDIRCNQKYQWYISQIFRLKWLGINTRFNRVLLTFLFIYLNPFKYYFGLKKLMLKSLRTNEFYC